MSPKIQWRGTITSVQPRIRLLRSFDQAHHSYLGFVLVVDGTIGGDARQFAVATGKAAHAKHQFRIAMEIGGEGIPIGHSKLETADLYKISKLKIIAPPPQDTPPPPPWLTLAPELEVYRQRGHRRLDSRVYANKCTSCIWGCRMPVEMIIDQWNPSNKRYRYETFCYGQKSCPHYRPGKCRVFPGRKGMSWIEEDWVDEDATAHRGDDE